MRYRLTMVLLLVVLAACMIPIPETPLDEVNFIDKWTHVAMFVALQIVFFTELNRNRTALGLWRMIVVTLILPMAVGGIIELMQEYLTDCRSGDIMDFTADCVGVATGWAVGMFVITPLFRHVRMRKRHGR